MCLIL
jgi:hypothetical protein